MARVDTRALGGGAEQLGARVLSKSGLTLVERNFRCRHGEIDLIALDGRQLVFAEVRYRGPGSLSRARLTVDTHKQRKLIRTAALYVARRPRFANSVMRFDVIAIDEDASGARTTEWIRDAFRPADSRL